MRLLRPVEYPANRPARRWVFDVLVTVLAAALSLPNLYQGGAHHWPGAAAFVVLALMVAPLVVRRIWPIPVFGWILVTADRRGLVGQAPGRRAGAAHRPVHGGEAAVAPRRAGLRRRARAHRGHRAAPARRRRLVA